MLALEQGVVQHYALREYESRLGNTSFHSGRLELSGCAGYVVYVAFQFEHLPPCQALLAIEQVPASENGDPDGRRMDEAARDLHNALDDWIAEEDDTLWNEETYDDAPEESDENAPP